MSLNDAIELDPWSNSLTQIEGELLSVSEQRPRAHASDREGHQESASHCIVLRRAVKRQRSFGVWNQNTEYCWTKDSGALSSLRTFLDTLTLERGALLGGVVLIVGQVPICIGLNSWCDDAVPLYSLTFDCMSNWFAAAESRKRWTMQRTALRQLLESIPPIWPGSLTIVFQELPFLKPYM